jgi:hypothetical protein
MSDKGWGKHKTGQIAVPTTMRRTEVAEDSGFGRVDRRYRQAAALLLLLSQDPSAGAEGLFHDLRGQQVHGLNQVIQVRRHDGRGQVRLSIADRDLILDSRRQGDRWGWGGSPCRLLIGDCWRTGRLGRGGR